MKPATPAAREASLLAARYRGIRRMTERVCEPLAIEDYVAQSTPDVSPTKWHLAHVSSAYSPYPGLQPEEGALDEYNGKFMCNQYVLRGGSCVTPGSHVRSTYRNFFPPASRWPFTGIRLAR